MRLWNVIRLIDHVNVTIWYPWIEIFLKKTEGTETYERRLGYREQYNVLITSVVFPSFRNYKELQVLVSDPEVVFVTCKTGTTGTWLPSNLLWSHRANKNYKRTNKFFFEGSLPSFANVSSNGHSHTNFYTIKEHLPVIRTKLSFNNHFETSPAHAWANLWPVVLPT